MQEQITSDLYFCNDYCSDSFTLWYIGVRAKNLLKKGERSRNGWQYKVTQKWKKGRKSLDRHEYFHWPEESCDKKVLLFLQLFVAFSLFCFLDLPLYRSMLLMPKRAKPSSLRRLIRVPVWHGVWSPVMCLLMFLLLTSHCSGQLLTPEQKERGT